MTASLSAPVVATAKMYLSCARRAFEGLSKNWVLLISSLVLGVVFRIVASAVGGTGSFAGGFVVGLFGVFCISLYYSCIWSTLLGE